MLFILIFSILPNVEVLEYKLYWAGIEAGFLRLKYEEFEDTIEINMQSQTTGIVKNFYFMEDEARSIMRKKDFQTLLYYKKIKEKKKEKEEISIFFPEENIYFFKFTKYYDFFATDTLSIFYLIRLKKDIKSPIKVFENGKFYDVYLQEENNFIFNYKSKKFKTKKITLLRNDKKNANIFVYLLEENKNLPYSIEFSFPLGLIRAILQCY